MGKHKSEVSSNECICDKCAMRFSCFTQERVFSDTKHQSLFEAYIALGFSRDGAVETVIRVIRGEVTTTVAVTPPYTYTSPNTVYTLPYESITGIGTGVQKSFTTQGEWEK